MTNYINNHEVAAANATSAAPGVCEACGGTARVHVLRGYQGGTPLVGWYCLDCAKAASLSPVQANSVRNRLSLPLLLALAGVVLGILGGAGDLIGTETSPGFGWSQRAGVLLGLLFVLLGMMLRIDLLALGGVFMFGGALVADWVGPLHSPGIGWKQQLALGMAASLLLAAAGIRLTVRFRRRPAADNGNTG